MSAASRGRARAEVAVWERADVGNSMHTGRREKRTGGEFRSRAFPNGQLMRLRKYRFRNVLWRWSIRWRGSGAKPTQ